MMWGWGMPQKPLPPAEHPNAQCRARGPGLSHIRHPISKNLCKHCNWRLDDSLPDPSGTQEPVLTAEAIEERTRPWRDVFGPTPPFPHPLWDESSGDTIDVSPIRFVAHPTDPEAADFHVIGMRSMPHTHDIREDWSSHTKNRIARHIDRWHFRREP